MLAVPFPAPRLIADVALLKEKKLLKKKKKKERKQVACFLFVHTVSAPDGLINPQSRDGIWIILGIMGMYEAMLLAFCQLSVLTKSF